MNKVSNNYFEFLDKTVMNPKLYIFCFIFCYALSFLNLSDYICFDMNLLIALFCTSWTGVIAIIVFYLGKIEERFFGIRRITMMSYLYGVRRIKLLIIFFILELLFVFISIIMQSNIVMFFMLITQICFTIAAFSMMFFLGSRNECIFCVEQQLFNCVCDNESIKDIMFFDMISNINYENETDLSMLLNILNNIIELDFKEELKDTIMDAFFAINSCSKKTILDVIKVWYSNVIIKDKDNSNDKWKNTIIKGVVRHLENIGFEELENILAICNKDEKEIQRQAYMLAVVYNIYCETYTTQRWRKYYTIKLLKRLDKSSDDNNCEYINIWLNLFESKSEGLNKIRFLLNYLYDEQVGGLCV